jgi:glucose-1-phosphate cytidylyltransferase
VKTVILCGGRGMRLNEETEFRPKPLVPIGGKPILSHIMQIYAQASFHEFILCLGYRGELIKEYFLNHDTMTNDFTIRLGCRHPIEFNSSHQEEYCVTLADTGLETMTGGRLKKVQRYVDGKTFMLTYGDGLADINISALLEFHRWHGRLATVTAVHPSSRFGVLQIGEDHKVVNFSEKPMMDDWINIGFLVFESGVFDYITDDCVLETDVLPKLAKAGELMAYKHKGFFFAMDTYRDYRYLNDMYDRGETPWIK